jgi:hypothetical protein
MKLLMSLNNLLEKVKKTLRTISYAKFLRGYILDKEILAKSILPKIDKTKNSSPLKQFENRC